MGGRPYHPPMTADDGRRTAAVLTVSDGVAEGSRDDRSGPAIADRLRAAGFDVLATDVVADERAAIESSLRTLAEGAALVVTTGGTGLGPRDVTPEATRAVIEREVPGLAEAMRAAGRASTPAADLSRGVAGSIGGTLVINLPGSERGAVESLGAVLDAIPHAVELLSGRTEHGAPPAHADAVDNHDRVVATAIRVHGDPPCRPGQKLIVGGSGPVSGTLGCAEFDAAATADVPAVLASGEPATGTYEHELGSVEVYLEPQVGPARLVVLAATPVAEWLLRWGRDAGLETTLVEPRAARVTPAHRASADAVVERVEDARIDERTDAVHTDHDAPLVAEELVTLLRSPARFVGAMGSRRHTGPHVEALRSAGLSESELARLRTPVGLDVGARTPQEIALSILAGIVAARNQRDGGWLDGEGAR